MGDGMVMAVQRSALTSAKDPLDRAPVFVEVTYKCWVTDVAGRRFVAKAGEVVEMQRWAADDVCSAGRGRISAPRAGERR
jgi:hypothetical protein